MTTIQKGQFITIPGRITHAQFGCSPKVFNEHIKGQKVLVVDISKDGQFYTLYAARELWTAHAEILVSDDQHQKNKEKAEGKQQTQNAA